MSALRIQRPCGKLDLIPSAKRGKADNIYLLHEGQLIES